MLKYGLVGLALVGSLAASSGGDDGHTKAMDACLSMRFVDSYLQGGVADNTETVNDAGNSAKEAMEADAKYTKLGLLVIGFQPIVKAGEEPQAALTMRSIIDECVALGYPWGDNGSG